MKTGLATTAFWVTLLTNLIAFFNGMQGYMSPLVSLIIIAAANAAYGILRTYQKVSTGNTGKPGYFTTEFIMAVITNLIGLATALHGQFANAQVITIILGSLNSLYAVLRTWLGTTNDTVGPAPDPALGPTNVVPGK
jgi:heme/copper-type cytochrome/quinol oxidase subunit 4